MKRDIDPKMAELLSYLHNIDAREVLDEVGIHYDETGKNVSDGWLGVNCPFCTDPSNHMGVNIVGKSISCFSCGTTGTIIKLVSNQIGYRKAVDYLLTKVPKELINFALDENSINVDFVEGPDKMKSKKTKHWNYLKKRGFNPKKLFREFDLQCITDKTEEYEYRNRIFVPIYHRNRLVTFSTISIEDDPYLRYLHCPDDESIISIKSLLYGHEQTGGRVCTLVEGIFDKWRIGKQAVTSWGTKLTEEQIKILSTYDRVKLCFDGDRPGKEASEKYASQLCVFTEVVELFLPSGKDPDKLSKKDVDFIRNF